MLCGFESCHEASASFNCWQGSQDDSGEGSGGDGVIISGCKTLLVGDFFKSGGNSMGIATVLFFLLVTMYFIWNSEVSYGGKTLAGIGKAFIGILIAIIAIGFLLKGLAAIISGFTRYAAGDLMEAPGASLLFI